MNKRLQAIAQIVQTLKIRHLADVGCDHAWLSIMLLRPNSHQPYGTTPPDFSNRVGWVQHVTNIDANVGPLVAGQENARAHGLIEGIEVVFHQGNGLKGYQPSKWGVPEAVVVAGLGWKTIQTIVEESSIQPRAWILQANGGQQATLRKWLIETKGYQVLEERFLVENGIPYEIDCFVPQSSHWKLIPEEQFWGPFLFQAIQQGAMSNQFWQQLWERLRHLQRITKQRSGDSGGNLWPITSQIAWIQAQCAKWWNKGEV